MRRRGKIVRPCLKFNFISQIIFCKIICRRKTTAALWLKLESICMSKDLTSKIYMKMKLYMHKLEEDGYVVNYLSIFKEIISDLHAMEVDYDDENLAHILLCSLPSSFANF